MKQLILLQLLFLTSLPAFCQHEESMLKSSQLKANLVFLGASASYETRISPKNTLNFEASLNYGLAYSYSSSMGENFGYTLGPGISAEARHYYNLAKRVRLGKSTLNNSGNFLSLQLGYQFAPIDYNNIYANPFLSLTPAWGMQRRVGRRFSFEGVFGFSVQYETNSSLEVWNATPSIQLKFGYVIF